MYLSLKVEAGVVYMQSTPDGAWRPASLAMVTELYLDAEKRISVAHELIGKLEELLDFHHIDHTQGERLCL